MTVNACHNIFVHIHSVTPNVKNIYMPYKYINLCHCLRAICQLYRIPWSVFNIVFVFGFVFWGFFFSFANW